jgi:tRNA pseudouridine55 synthase
VGITSFDVVRRVRRASRVRRVGHAGTLDPLASGVLPIALGEATRFIDELVDARKRYVTTIVLGIATDTYDAEGSATKTADASHLTVDDIRVALAAFVGEHPQVPPAYSAVKRAGVTAYAAARAGSPLELEARTVTAFALNLTDYRALDSTIEIRVEIECSKGYYVRSLAHDLGATLGVGGHVSGLIRTAVGRFRIEDAIPLEVAEALLEGGESERIVLSPDAVLLDLPAVILGDRSLAALRNGQELRPAIAAIRRVLAPGARARCYGPDGNLAGILRATEIPGQWHPYRVIPYQASAKP